VEAGAFGDGELGCEVCRRPKAVKAEATSWWQLGAPKRSISDYAGTQQWRTRYVVEVSTQRVREALVDESQLCVTAGNVPAREDG
jgi:hypothetical protein